MTNDESLDLHESIAIRQRFNPANAIEITKTPNKFAIRVEQEDRAIIFLDVDKEKIKKLAELLMILTSDDDVETIEADEP